jgi:hypothetical protein
VIELEFLDDVVSRNSRFPTVICFDLFGFPVGIGTASIAQIRNRHPKAVFNLYVDYHDLERRSQELPEDWQTRITHYNKSFKDDPEAELEPSLRAAMRPSVQEALYNMDHDPIRLTEGFLDGIVTQNSKEAVSSSSPIAFVSYSRSDWDGFVSQLVKDLGGASQPVWIDQNFIVGGDDWMDAISEALEVCSSLLLVLSPAALSSKYVKMEYRHFFRQDKPIIPVLYQQVDRLPFELASLHYLDFTSAARSQSYADLLAILKQQQAPKRG